MKGRKVGQTIVLDREPGVPDGTEVEVIFPENGMPAADCHAAKTLLQLPAQERAQALAAAAADAAPLYAADLALSPQERELTAFTILDGEEFEDGGP